MDRPAGTFASIVESLRSRGGTTVLVGVDGFGGSGKSTFAERLARAAGPGALVVHTDDFVVPGTRGLVYDTPRLTAEVAEPLRAGRASRYRRYDWPSDAVLEWHDLPTSAFVVVEGISALRPEHRDAYDLRVWVESPRELRLARGVARDGEAARARWEDEFMPSEERYAREHDPRAVADLVVDGTGGDEAAPALVEDRRRRLWSSAPGR